MICFKWIFMSVRSSLAVLYPVQPEFQREQPGLLGVSDSAGLLAVLHHCVGYTGPVVCEPFNRRLGRLPLQEAVGDTCCCYLGESTPQVADTAYWMDRTFTAAERWPEERPEVWRALAGSQPYHPDPEESGVGAGGLAAPAVNPVPAPTRQYTGEGGIAFSEERSVEAVLGTVRAGGRAGQVRSWLPSCC